MPYYLAPYIGSGTFADSYRPLGSDQPGWKAIDLRPDPSRADGGGLNACVLYLPTHDPDPGLTTIVADRQELVSPAVRNQIRNRLGLTDLTEADFPSLIAAVLTRPPVGAWKRLVATSRLDRYQIFLDGLLWEAPVVRAASDDFNRANEAPIGAPWSNMSFGDQDIALSGNRMVAGASTGEDMVYYTDATTSADQYSQAVMSVVGYSGPSARMNDPGATLDMYFHRMNDTDAGLKKYVNGTITDIDVHGIFGNAGDLIRIECEGSTIRGFVEGVEEATVTDTSITTEGNGVGMFIATGEWDDWEGGDLAEVVTGLVYKRFFGPSQLTGSAADLYIVPTGRVARVLNIHASNPSGSPVDLTLSIGDDAAATRVYDDFEIGADSIESNFDPYDLAAGEKIQGFASTAATVNLTITGWEDDA